MFMVKHMGSSENSVGSIIVPIKYFMQRNTPRDERGLSYQWFGISEDLDQSIWHGNLGDLGDQDAADSRICVAFTMGTILPAHTITSHSELQLEVE